MTFHPEKNFQKHSRWLSETLEQHLFGQRPSNVVTSTPASTLPYPSKGPSKRGFVHAKQVLNSLPLATQLRSRPPAGRRPSGYNLKLFDGIHLFNPTHRRNSGTVCFVKRWLSYWLYAICIIYAAMHILYRLARSAMLAGVCGLSCLSYLS